MKKLALFLAALFLMMSFVSAQQDYEEFYDRYQDSVVTVQVSNETGNSVGTGFIYNGSIVTSNHVIVSEGEVYPEVQVGLGNSTDEEDLVDAEVVGRDEGTDLAVLRPEDEPLERQGLQISESAAEPGQNVVVIGNAYGMESTITHGIVSGVNRTLVTDEGVMIEGAIQIDAPINPGNSGGPLMDENGRILGVINSRTGENIGFAVNRTAFKDVFADLTS